MQVTERTERRGGIRTVKTLHPERKQPVDLLHRIQRTRLTHGKSLDQTQHIKPVFPVAWCLNFSFEMISKLTAAL